MKIDMARIETKMRKNVSHVFVKLYKFTKPDLHMRKKN